MIDASILLMIFLPLFLVFVLVATLCRIRVIKASPNLGSAFAGPGVLRGEVTNLELNSDEPGTILATWDAAVPAPSEYRVNWASSIGEFPSYEETFGNAYPQANAFRITGLVAGAEYHVRVRSRYLDENGRELERGPWTPMARVVVAGGAHEAAGAMASDALDDHECGVAEMLDESTRERIRAFALRVLPGKATPQSVQDDVGDTVSDGDDSRYSLAGVADRR